MLVSKIEQKYGINSTQLNRLCRKVGVVPIYMCSFYYINKDLQIYYLDNRDNELQFIMVTPYKYTKKHRIPIYLLKDDMGNSVQLRLDYIYLSTWYGPMPKTVIHYQKDEIFITSKHLYYSVDIYESHQDDIIMINGILFKHVTLSSLRDIYVSQTGVIFDNKKKIDQSRRK